jgi:hypothetical protein
MPLPQPIAVMGDRNSVSTFRSPFQGLRATQCASCFLIVEAEFLEVRTLAVTRTASSSPDQQCPWHTDADEDDEINRPNNCAQAPVIFGRQVPAVGVNRTCGIGKWRDNSHDPQLHREEQGTRLDRKARFFRPANYSQAPRRNGSVHPGENLHGGRSAASGRDFLKDGLTSSGC